jgi:riboflavin synthase
VSGTDRIKPDKVNDMFTGIVQGVATVTTLTDKPGLRSFTLGLPPRFTDGLQIGASVSVDGVCLTVTRLHDGDAADFDVVMQSLSLTTLSALHQGDRVNVERAAGDGSEVGGHPLSGHIDFSASVTQMRAPENNRVLRVSVPSPWMRYLFAKGYVALNGASLTLAEVQREPDGSGWFEVWLIPETLRMTTFREKKVGSTVNVEIERQTQIFVDTIRDVIHKEFTELAHSMKLTDAASIGRSSLSIGGLRKMATKKQEAAKKKGKSRTLRMKPRDTQGQGPGPHAKSPRKKK